MAEAGQEPVDDPVVVRDVAFHLLGETQILQSTGMQAALLARQVREVLLGNRREPEVIVGPRSPAESASRAPRRRQPG